MTFQLLLVSGPVPFGPRKLSDQTIWKSEICGTPPVGSSDMMGRVERTLNIDCRILLIW
jgi:hypothetical protein